MKFIKSETHSVLLSLVAAAMSTSGCASTSTKSDEGSIATPPRTPTSASDSSMGVSPAAESGTHVAHDASAAAHDASTAAPDASALGTARDAGTDSADAGAFPSTIDVRADGPFSSKVVESTGPNDNYTVFLPEANPPDGSKHPLVAWMSGGSSGPSLYPLLPRLATHGFVVVASNTVPDIGEELQLGGEIIAGIDWALKENERAGSVLFGKLNSSRIASMGYSMGSLATFTIAQDPRLTTTVHISGGNMVADRVNNLHAPAAFFCGVPQQSCDGIFSTDCDVAAANCDADFEAAKSPVFYGTFPGGHTGILLPPLQDQIYAEIVAWLRWQLLDDATLKARFVGEHCGVCQDSNWKVKQKNLQ